MPRRPASIHSEHSNTDRLEPRLLRAVEANSIPDVQDIIQQAKTRGQWSQNFLSVGLVRACDKNLVDPARFLLSQGADPDYASGNKPPSLLRAAEYGLIEIAETLIDHDANLEARDKKGRTALMTAAWRGHLELVQIILSRGANVDTVDLRRRTVLHNIAADKGDQKNSKTSSQPTRRCGIQIVRCLLEAGANAEDKDELGRTALHWTCVTDHEDLMRLLLASQLEGACQQSGLRHAVRGKATSEGTSRRVVVDPRDNREKTPLHLAASHGRVSLVRVLLDHGADVQAKSDGSWTALHSACASGSGDLVQALLDAGADVNSELLNGRTPLHVAAECGNQDAAKCLLRIRSCRRDVKDRFGTTPLLMAAQHGRRQIAEMLAPWNHLDDLSNDEIEASRQFNATIVDFGDFRNENRVLRRSVFELLYARDARDRTKHSISTLPRNIKATNFRWIHLPANNIAWCEALLTKRFIEEGGTDIDGYKALATSFNHQHKGHQHHSRFMRPMCQAVQRATAALDEIKASNDRMNGALNELKSELRNAKIKAKSEGKRETVHELRNEVTGELKNEDIPKLKNEASSDVKGELKSEVRSEARSKPGSNLKRADPSVILSSEPASLATLKEIKTEASKAGDGLPIDMLQPEQQGDLPHLETGPKSPKAAKTPSRVGKWQNTISSEDSKSFPKAGNNGGRSSTKRKDTSSTVTTSQSSHSSKLSKHTGAPFKPTKRPRKQDVRNESTTSDTAGTTEKASNIFLFLPYLHFETDRRRREMQHILQNPDCLHNLDLSTRADEILFRAQFAKTSSFLHVRRTLDQFFYHNIDTRTRDGDQVVYRFQQKHHHNDSGYDPKIFMVDQLWMWILGKDLVVTSFPQRWRQPRNDPLNVLEGIIEDINSKTREPVQNVYELAMTIAGRCFGTFDRHRKGDEDFQFLDMFESSIGAAMDGEATLFRDFSQASRQASEWLQSHQRPNRLSRNLEAESKERHHAAKKAEHEQGKDGETEEADNHAPQFVDRLLDVGSETDLLAEIKDIRDELDIIRMVLGHQEHLLPELREAIKAVYREERSLGQLRKVDKVFEEQEKTIANPLKDINRMDLQAERIYDSLRDLLDLKQKHANAFEARFARDQAAGTRRQGQTLMVFTIVTVVFLPLSFISSIFSMSIRDFQDQTWSWAAPYLFGIGLAISIPCIVVAFTVDELGYFATRTKRRLRVWWWKRKNRRGDPSAQLQLQAMDIEHTLTTEKKSVERGRSFELGNLKRPDIGDRRYTESISEQVYGPRRLSMWDLERGKSRRREAVY